MIEFKEIQPLLMEEWNSSLENSLSPYIKQPTICLAQPVFKKELKQNDDLIAIFSECTYELFCLDCVRDYLFFLINKDLCLIAKANYTGSKTLLDKNGLKTGISFSNKSIGVNAVSLSSKYDQPIYLDTNQHFCLLLRHFYSCAIPIKISGSVVAYLNILTPDHEASKKFKYLLDLLSAAMMNKLHLFQCRKYKNMLSSIQLQILTLLANGNTEMEIAESLNYSIQSIKYHKHEIYKKFDVKNTANAISKLYRYKNINCSYT